MEDQLARKLAAILYADVAGYSALTCAVEIQKSLKEENAALPQERKVCLRVGVNLGEVIVDRRDIYGDCVNVAARLENLAEPGGICISHTVRTAATSYLYNPLVKPKLDA